MLYICKIYAIQLAFLGLLESRKWRFKPLAAIFSFRNIM